MATWQISSKTKIGSNITPRNAKLDKGHLLRNFTSYVVRIPERVQVEVKMSTSCSENEYELSPKREWKQLQVGVNFYDLYRTICLYITIIIMNLWSDIFFNYIGPTRLVWSLEIVVCFDQSNDSKQAIRVKNPWGTPPPLTRIACQPSP